MKKYKLFSSVLFIFLFAFLFPVTASANSSWHWISKTRPYDVLPFVIALTLAIEILSLRIFAKTKNLPKIAFFVMLANILSFVAPYFLLHVTPSLYTFEQTLEHWPFYTVGFAYLLVTLIIEVPTVFLALKKNSCNSKKLLLVIAVANFTTTVLTAVIERVVCRGVW